jgi:hypothetical protein
MHADRPGTIAAPVLLRRDAVEKLTKAITLRFAVQLLYIYTFIRLEGIDVKTIG